MKALLLTLALLTGCSTPLEHRTKVQTTTITWINETPTTCGDAKGHINACATRYANFTHCTIRMPWGTVDWIVAEEMKHCFGWEHVK